MGKIRSARPIEAYSNRNFGVSSAQCAAHCAHANIVIRSGRLARLLRVAAMLEHIAATLGADCDFA